MLFNTNNHRSRQMQGLGREGGSQGWEWTERGRKGEKVGNVCLCGQFNF